MKSFRTPDQLVRMYRASESGSNTHEIAAAEHISYASTLSALNYLRKYLKGKTRGQKRHAKSYREAIKLIRQEKRTEPLQVTTAPHRQPQMTSQGDNFSFLKSSFERFQDAVGTFIEVETNSRYTTLKDENKALQEDNKALRKEVTKLREEIEQLRKEEPRTIDWIDTLQGKLTKEET